MQTEKTFNTGELTLHYTDSETAGKPLVLLHGLTARRQSWMPLIPTLAQHFHVYAFDLRGHGATGHAPDEQYRNVDYARDVIAFLKHLGEPAVVIGHSLGAMVCIVTAAEYPNGVRAAVLLDPPLFSYTDGVHILPQTEQWFRLAASINRGDPSPDERLERLRAAMPDAPAEQINQMAGYLAGVVSGAPEVALRDGAWEGLPLPDALQRIECPTLMIHGDWDSGAVIRASDIDYVKSYLPSVATVHLNGADHGLKIDQQPELVLDPVLAFLNTI